MRKMHYNEMHHFYRAAYMQGGLSDCKGVRLSVCPSHA